MTPAVVSEIGRRLRRIRLEKNLTLEEVARRSGLGATTVGECERGVYVDLGVARLERIAGALGVSLGTLVGQRRRARGSKRNAG